MTKLSTPNLNPGLLAHSHADRVQALSAAHASADHEHAELVEAHRRARLESEAARDAAIARAEKAAEDGRSAATAKLAEEWRGTMRPLVDQWLEEPTRLVARKIASVLSDFDGRAQHALGARLSPHALVSVFAEVIVDQRPAAANVLAADFSGATSGSTVSIATRALGMLGALGDLERALDDLESTLLREAERGQGPVNQRMLGRFNARRGKLVAADITRALAEFDRQARDEDVALARATASTATHGDGSGRFSTVSSGGLRPSSSLRLV